MQTTQPTRRQPARWFKRPLKWAAYLALAFAALLLVGHIPVNNNFKPASEGIKLHIVSSAVHADILVPKTTSVVDWVSKFPPALFSGDVTAATHVAFGWGDRGFFLETETWDDLTPSVAATALLMPSSSCAHITFTRPEYFPNAVSVTVSEDQYRQLVEFFEQTLQTDQVGDYIPIPNRAYSSQDAFFESNGKYHALNTCNSWVGRGLRAAGVRVPWLSPLPSSPTIYLSGEKRAQ